MLILNQRATEHTIIGVEVQLTTQELIALKDKQQAIESTLGNYANEDEGPKRKHSRQVLNELLPLLENMSVFINILTDGVVSTSEVHDELFVNERIRELEQSQVEH